MRIQIDIILKIVSFIHISFVSLENISYIHFILMIKKKKETIRQLHIHVKKYDKVPQMYVWVTISFVFFFEYAWKIIYHLKNFLNLLYFKNVCTFHRYFYILLKLLFFFHK